MNYTIFMPQTLTDTFHAIVDTVSCIMHYGLTYYLMFSDITVDGEFLLFSNIGTILTILFSATTILSAEKQPIKLSWRKIEWLPKYEITTGEMAALLIRCLGFRELKGDWNTNTVNVLRMDCSGKLPDVELKWILVYTDLHYVVKDSAKEALLLFELAGRQMGMPSPHGDISANYKFK